MQRHRVPEPLVRCGGSTGNATRLKWGLKWEVMGNVAGEAVGQMGRGLNAQRGGGGGVGSLRVTRESATLSTPNRRPCWGRQASPHPFYDFHACAELMDLIS